MPYINEQQRRLIDHALKDIVYMINATVPADEQAGVCNYAVTRILDGVFNQQRYNKINTAIGVLECAKLEFYRRRAAGYEDQKMAENGDAYANPLNVLP